MGRDFPGERHHQERKGGARDDLQPAFAASRRCAGGGGRWGGGGGQGGPVGPPRAGGPGGEERREGRTRAHARRAPGTMDLRARGCYHGHCPMHGINTLQRMPKNVVAALAITATLAAGVAGGFAARYVHLPLPWLLGAL